MQQIFRQTKDALRERLADPTSMVSVVARLTNDYGRPYWQRYALAFAYMALGAGCTAARFLKPCLSTPFELILGPVCFTPLSCACNRLIW